MNCNVSRYSVQSNSKLLQERHNNSKTCEPQQLQHYIIVCLLFYLLFVGDVGEYFEQWNSSVGFGAENLSRVQSKGVQPVGVYPGAEKYSTG
jgi:hypothetical protein